MLGKQLHMFNDQELEQPEPKSHPRTQYGKQPKPRTVKIQIDHTVNQAGIFSQKVATQQPKPNRGHFIKLYSYFRTYNYYSTLTPSQSTLGSFVSSVRINSFHAGNLRCSFHVKSTVN